ncbi:sigma 54-interacting transcriptional regulator [bacterium]|nr:sigma 54-interacting transcriptional regulator [bacterium]
MKKTNLEKNIENLTRDLELFNLVFDSFVNGAIITDAEGRVTHLNKPYGEFLGIDPGKYIGRHCTQVIENTRMHIVARTGIPEINHSHLIKGQNILVHRIPIKKENRVIAVFGLVMFQNMREITELAEKTSLLESKVKLYEQELRLYRSTRYTLDSIIGKSPIISDLKNEALRATSTDFPVLITGESGTGKELFAQSIHHGSTRNIYPFVRINCAAIPKDLLESELFGYEKGAFTGADSRGKPGKFELADHGTIFLDEVGDLPLEMQPKLLRVLEEKEFERIGGNRIIKSDFRLIAATNRNLEELMDQKLFRQDLFYRMNVIPLSIPPLRKRRNDIWPLTLHLLKQMATEIFPGGVSIDPEVRQAFLNYHWPGNVREIQNVLERALTSLDGTTIQLHHLPLHLYRQSKNQTNRQTVLRGVSARAEKEAIIETLKETGNNKTHAANLLGIHRTLLYKKMNRYGIPHH